MQSNFMGGLLTTGPFAGFYLLVLQQPSSTEAEIQTWIVTITAALMGIVKLALLIQEYQRKRKHK